MSEANSKYFGYGRRDGHRDSRALSACPPREPAGPDQSKVWSAMYRRGYMRTFDPQPCQCERCRARERPRKRAKPRAPLAMPKGGSAHFKPRRGQLKYEPGSWRMSDKKREQLRERTRTEQARAKAELDRRNGAKKAP